jgi:hypothetical protein
MQIMKFPKHTVTNSNIEELLNLTLMVDSLPDTLAKKYNESDSLYSYLECMIIAMRVGATRVISS